MSLVADGVSLTHWSPTHWKQRMVGVMQGWLLAGLLKERGRLWTGLHFKIMNYTWGGISPRTSYSVPQQSKQEKTWNKTGCLTTLRLTAKLTVSLLSVGHFKFGTWFWHERNTVFQTLAAITITVIAQQWFKRKKLVKWKQWQELWNS